MQILDAELLAVHDHDALEKNVLSTIDSLCTNKLLKFKDEIASIKNNTSCTDALANKSFNDLMAKIMELEDRIPSAEKQNIWSLFIARQNKVNDELLGASGNAIDDRADFAQRVVYHTEIMTASMIEMIEFKLYYLLTRKYDQSAVRPTLRSGDCTPLKHYNDSSNYIIFELRESVHVNGVSIEYIRPSLLQNKIESSPKNMSLELSQDGFHYFDTLPVRNRHLLFDPMKDRSKKYFAFDRQTKQKYNFAKLNILSNHGAAYTCLYRVQIHGVIDE